MPGTPRDMSDQESRELQSEEDPATEVESVPESVRPTEEVEDVQSAIDRERAESPPTGI